MASVATINSAFAISGAFTVVPMAEFEPAGMTKAICIAESSPDKDKSFLVVEAENIRFWQSLSTARKTCSCRQNDLWPQWQFLKFAQMLIIGPANFDSGTKFPCGQIPDINETQVAQSHRHLP